MSEPQNVAAELVTPAPAPSSASERPNVSVGQMVYFLHQYGRSIYLAAIVTQVWPDQNTPPGKRMVNLCVFFPEGQPSAHTRVLSGDGVGQWLAQLPSETPSSGV